MPTLSYMYFRLFVLFYYFMQWSFGVTCWEIYSAGKTPYPGVHPIALMGMLEKGERLPKPMNAACSDQV